MDSNINLFCDSPEEGQMLDSPEEGQSALTKT